LIPCRTPPRLGTQCCRGAVARIPPNGADDRSGHFTSFTRHLTAPTPFGEVFPPRDAHEVRLPKRWTGNRGPSSKRPTAGRSRFAFSPPSTAGQFCGDQRPRFAVWLTSADAIQEDDPGLVELRTTRGQLPGGAPGQGQAPPGRLERRKKKHGTVVRHGGDTRDPGDHPFRRFHAPRWGGEWWGGGGVGDAEPRHEPDPGTHRWGLNGPSRGPGRRQRTGNGSVGRRTQSKRHALILGCSQKACALLENSPGNHPRPKTFRGQDLQAKRETWISPMPQLRVVGQKNRRDDPKRPMLSVGWIVFSFFFFFSFCNLHRSHLHQAGGIN